MITVTGSGTNMVRLKNYLNKKTTKSKLLNMVSAIRAADPGCLSRNLIFTHSGSRILDQKTATKERSEKKLLSYLFCSHKFHKI